MNLSSIITLLKIIMLFTVTTGFVKAQTDPLPSWNDGKVKQQILSFVSSVTDPSSADFVTVKNRIVTFDNDGTLWAEQPIYAQLLFAFSRVGKMAANHPKWQTEQPFASLLKGDVVGALTSGPNAAEKIVLTTQTGMSNNEFKSLARNWVLNSIHPETGKKTIDMVYVPMIELITYFQNNNFKTYIVTGGDTQFIQAWAEIAYNIPPEQVIGSLVKQTLKIQDGQTKIIRQPEFKVMNNKTQKAIGILNQIGKRPIAAFGNSDGDLQMLQYAALAEGKRLSVIIHHTDEEREWKYDRKSQIGTLDKALDEANKQGWIIIDMKRDWKTVFPGQ